MTNQNDEYELQEFPDSLNSSIGNRLAAFAKEFGLDKNLRLRSQESGLIFVNCWSRIIIPKKSRKYQLWVYSVLAWAIYSSFFTPFEFGFFRGLPKHLWWVDQAGQLIFLADIVVNFFVAYKDMQTYKWVVDHRSIALRYAKTSFIPDVLGCLPWDVIYKGTGRREAVRYLLWVRLYRVRKVTSFFHKLEKDIRINYLFTRIVKLLTVELYCTHTAACIFYYLATTLASSQEDLTWIGSLSLGGYDYHDFRSIDLGKRYVTSLYWAIVTMATVGYGDVHAVNTREMIFVMIFVSFDMILGAYLIGNMTALIVKGSNTEKYRDKMTVLIKYMNRNKLAKDLRTQMKSHFQLQYESKFTENAILEDLPFYIRAKVFQSLYYSTMEAVPLFQNCSSEFINQIARRVHEEFFLPGEVIMEQGSAVDQMYIVTQGTLEEVLVNLDGSEEIIALLEPDSVFGEVATLCNISQPYTVRVCELCKLLRIDKESFSDIMLLFFNDGRQILRNLKTKDTETRIKQLDSDIEYSINKQEAELALRVINAASYGNFAYLKNLVKTGADPKKPDYDGRTPLHLAASRGHEDIVVFLMRQGVDVNYKDNFGYTPLLEALKGSHHGIAAILMEGGASLQDTQFQILRNAITSGNSLFLKGLLAHGVDPNLTDHDGQTLLHLAASCGLPLIMKALVNHGANIFAKDRWGKTPIDEARQYGARSLLSIFEETTTKNHMNEYSGEPQESTASITVERDSGLASALVYHPSSDESTDEGLKHTVKKTYFGGNEIESIKRLSISHNQGSTGSGDPFQGSKRCTIFGYHPWTPEQHRTTGVVIWVPDSLEDLLHMASKHFGHIYSHVLNEAGGEILTTDFVQDSEKLYMVDEKSMFTGPDTVET